MQFTREINWSGFDFLIAGILLFGTAFCVDMVLNMEKKNAKRMFYIVIILNSFFSALFIMFFPVIHNYDYYSQHCYINKHT